MSWNWNISQYEVDGQVGRWGTRKWMVTKSTLGGDMEGFWRWGFLHESLIVSLTEQEKPIYSGQRGMTEYETGSNFNPVTVIILGREVLLLFKYAVPQWSIWPGNLTRAAGKLCFPSYSPTYRGTWTESPARSSASLQTKASGPIWPGNSVHSSSWFRSPNNELC